MESNVETILYVLLKYLDLTINIECINRRNGRNCVCETKYRQILTDLNESITPEARECRQKIMNFLKDRLKLLVEILEQQNEIRTCRAHSKRNSKRKQVKFQDLEEKGDCNDNGENSDNKKNKVNCGCVEPSQSNKRCPCINHNQFEDIARKRTLNDNDEYSENKKIKLNCGHVEFQSQDFVNSENRTTADNDDNRQNIKPIDNKAKRIEEVFVKLGQMVELLEPFVAQYPEFRRVLRKLNDNS